MYIQFENRNCLKLKQLIISFRALSLDFEVRIKKLQMVFIGSTKWICLGRISQAIKFKKFERCMIFLDFFVNLKDDS